MAEDQDVGETMRRERVYLGLLLIVFASFQAIVEWRLVSKRAKDDSMGREAKRTLPFVCEANGYRKVPDQKPSRERLVVLLHECRVANRERVRLIQEYDKREDGCLTIHRGDNVMEKLTQSPLWKEEAVSVCRSSASPEQGFGVVNHGEAGY